MTVNPASAGAPHDGGTGGTTGAPDDPQATVVQLLAAEFLGTFTLMGLGLGYLAFSTSDLGGSGDVTAAFVFGLVTLGVGLGFWRLGAGHLNPVLSFSAALAGRISWVRASLLGAAQLVGAVAGAVFVVVVAAGFDEFDLFETSIGASSWGDRGTGLAWWAALVVELVTTALFVVVFLAATDRRSRHRDLAPVAVGLALTAFYLLSVPLVNGGMNPAKSIAAALFSGGDAFGALWVFVVGPVLGTAAGALAYFFVLGADGDVVPGGGLSSGRPKQASPAGQPWGAHPGSGGYGQPQQGGYGQQAGGYGQPQQGGYGQQQGGYPAQEQPIIQDGWQWDPQAQQWIPAQQGPWGPSDPAGGSTSVRG